MFDAGAVITFDLVPPTVELTKQDEPDGNATVDEPGGDVPYTIAITNTSDEPVRITTLTDTATYESPAGVTEFNLLSPTQPISDVDCSADLDDAIAPQQTVSCTFIATLSGNAQIVRDQVDVVVTDNDGQTATDLAEAQVPILDVRPEVEIVKTAEPLTISPGDDVTYKLVITNLSTVEEVALLTLVDDRFGDLLPECEQFGMATTLAPGASTTCEFGRVLDEAPDTTHTNVVTVSAADDETLVNLATLREFQDDLLLPVRATSEASVLTVGPDLELTKDDAAFVATAGQQTPFPYTITVVNVGEGEVNLADTVTVVDDLPDAFEWVAPAPSGCSINGQQLTCSIPAASVRPAGTKAVIVATARVKAGAVAGNFDNRAYVTTPDDAVTAPPPCTDTEAVAADNNVDCETTPVVSSITTALASECVEQRPVHHVRHHPVRSACSASSSKPRPPSGPSSTRCARPRSTSASPASSSGQRGTAALWGKVQEVRDAITDFKTSGKPIIAFLEYGGEQEFYLASACDKVFLLPTASLDLTGMATYELFLRGTLDKIGAYPGRAARRRVQDRLERLHREDLHAVPSRDGAVAQHRSLRAAGRGLAAGRHKTRRGNPHADRPRTVSSRRCDPRRADRRRGLRG